MPSENMKKLKKMGSACEGNRENHSALAYIGLIIKDFVCFHVSHVQVSAVKIKDGHF